MLTMLMTIVIMMLGVLALIVTDGNRKKYTDYQMRMFLRQAHISHQ